MNTWYFDSNDIKTTHEYNKSLDHVLNMRALEALFQNQIKSDT